MHQSAFGFSLPVEHLEDFEQYIEQILPETKKFYSVMTMNGSKPIIISQLSELEQHYGPGFEEILLYDEVYLTEGTAQIIGQKQDTLKIQTDDITYIGFRFKSELPQSRKTMKIVGTPNLNNYNDIITPQIIIKDWELIDLTL